jgi:hypothetical protein
VVFWILPPNAVKVEIFFSSDHRSEVCTIPKVLGNKVEVTD